MDPITSFTLVGSVIDLAGVLGRSIKNMNQIRIKYNTANLHFNVLDCQLNTLRNALEEMAKWKESGCSDQLLEGSHSAVQGISLLTMLVNERLQASEKNDDGTLTFGGKVNFLWDQAELREYLNQLNGQIMSLTVLLQAYTWYVKSIGKCWRRIP